MEKSHWETVIGLEIHVQLNTKSKLFSGASTAFGAEPNTQACAIDLGFPGTLPVPNREAFRKAASFGFAIDAKVNRRSVFERKNYFYPDLPKGYQITQLGEPIVEHGRIDIPSDGGKKTIRIVRAHLEEDAGKSLHGYMPQCSGIDLNRAGIPLLEVVTEPDLRSPEEAATYARLIHQLVCYLDICDGEMSQGSFRCDANVSVRPLGQEELGVRTEIKNLNSFRFLEQAIKIEVNRHIDLLNNNEEITQETRLYDSEKNETRSMRDKETDADYRYFSDPDLLPIELDEKFLDNIRASLPELPEERKQRFVVELSLAIQDAEFLTANKDIADYFEAVYDVCKDSKLVANWIRVELFSVLNREDKQIKDMLLSPEQLGGLLVRILDKTISTKQAKEVFSIMWESGENADTVIERKGMKQESNEGTLRDLVEEVVHENPSQVEQYRNGKEKILGFLVGQVMKKSKGKANPQMVSSLMKEIL